MSSSASASIGDSGASGSSGGTLSLPTDLLSADQVTDFLFATAGVLLLTWIISVVFACHGLINYRDVGSASKKKKNRGLPTVGPPSSGGSTSSSSRRHHRPIPHLNGFDKFNTLLARRLLYRAAKVSANSGVGVALTLLSALSTQENSTAAHKTTIFLAQLFLGFVVTLLNLWSAMPANLQNELAVSRTKIHKLLRGGKIRPATAEALCDEIVDAINYHDRTNFVAYIESYREDRGSAIGSDEEGGN